MQQVVIMPMIGGGVFSSQMGGLLAAMGALIAHLSYGVILGATVGSVEHRVAHA